MLLSTASRDKYGLRIQVAPCNGRMSNGMPNGVTSHATNGATGSAATEVTAEMTAVSWSKMSDES